MYTESDIQVLQGFEHMRRRPAMYMPGGVSASAIAAQLTSQALELGARLVRTDVVGGWHVVSADLDWLSQPQDARVSPRQLFERVVGWPPRTNGIRSEALVGAYCTVAYIAVPAEHERVLGTAALPPEVAVALCPSGCHRSVAFTLNDG